MQVLRKASPLLGESGAIRELRDFIVGVSLLSEPVLITGPSGSGKGLSARKIHAVGRTARAPYVKICCDAFTTDELAALLFSGNPDEDGGGLLWSRKGGTIYLAGIEHLPAAISSELARYLRVTPCAEGGLPRLVFGSRFPLEDLQREEQVDATLVELVSAYHIWIPPLRDRLEDIPVLCSYQVWVNSSNDDYELRWKSFKDDVLPNLLTYPWPGNVAELNGVIERYCSGQGSGNPSEGMSVPVDLDIDDPVAYLTQRFAELHEELLETLANENRPGCSDLLIPGPGRRELFEDHAS